MMKYIKILTLSLLFGDIANSEVVDFVCKPGGSESIIQTARNFYYVSAGFPGADEYTCFGDFDESGVVGNTEQEVAVARALGGQAGLIGKMDTLRSYLIEAMLAARPTITSCADVPTSGSDTISTTESITYGTPVRTPPASFPLTTTYDKKMVYTNTDSTSENFGVIDFEFHCDLASQMAKYYRDIDGDGTDDQFVAVYYHGETATKYIDFFFYDENVSSNNLNLAVISRANTTDKTLNLWMTRTGINPTTQGFSAYRFAVASNYDTQAASIFYQDIAGEGLTSSDYTSYPNIDSVAVVGDEAPGEQNSTSNGLKQGCYPNFSVAGQSVTSTDLCTGLTPGEGPALLSGTLSFQSVQQNLATWLRAL